MKKNVKRLFVVGSIFLIAFIIWTVMIQIIDVQSIGQNGTDIGLATFNSWFHKLTGVHMTLYVITDWLGLVPVLACMVFGGMGLIQWVKRKSLHKVDCDIVILGIYYLTVIFAYLIFEMFPINYRPILIDGFLEASYPSSTTILVLCVMPTLAEQTERRIEHRVVRKATSILVYCFSVFMVLGRLVSGVHWFTDIVGGILLSIGLFYIYKAAILFSGGTHGIPRKTSRIEKE